MLLPSASGRRPRAAAVAVALVAAVGLAGVSASPPRAQAVPALGFSDGASLRWGEERVPQTRVGRLAAATGAGIQRIPISWAEVQPEPGTWNWERYDRVIRTMNRAGLRPLLVIERAPRWAHGPSFFDCVGRACPPTAAHLPAWGEFAARVATRYPRAAAIEVWNAPNVSGHWTTAEGPDPRRYARIFEAAAHRIHAARPRTPVLLGGGAMGDPRDSPPRANGFLARLYAVVDRSTLRRTDGLAIYAYSSRDDVGQLDGVAGAHLAGIRAVRDRQDPGRSLWITESGMTTTGPHRATAEQQRDAIETLLGSVRRADDIEAVMIHSLLEHPLNAIPAEQGWGVVRGAPTFAPKPAYCWLVARVAGPLDDVGCEGVGPRFRLGKRTHDARRGTARLRVSVPGPGRIVLSRTRAVKRFARERQSAGTAVLMIRPRAGARRRLMRAGGDRSHARIGARVRVRFLPDHGDEVRLARSLTLVRRR